MIRKIRCINSLVVLVLAAGCLIYPSLRAALDIRDPALRGQGIPKVAWRLAKNLTPRYAKWARERVVRGQAESLSTSDISGTEWPLFGSVFYLWAIEDLQKAWEGGDHTLTSEPRLFAREAIISASELVIDPKHASWVKKHWGEGYLHRENVFYRMLVTAALTSRQSLLHDDVHMDMLRDQVETFAEELDSSKTGLLDDYPGECYPGDVMAALMCIKRADAVLGTDHSRFIDKALRGFTGTRATRYQLPPYSASSATGGPESEARGCANSYMCTTAPELWPVQAKQWYAIYDKFFWQERITAVGYREFAKGLPRSDWMMDIDAGPVIAGHGVAASAFGVGAARKNGRFDRAYPLAAEMVATICGLPNGVLMIPRLLSNLSDAPFLGEAAILRQLTIQPEKGFPLTAGGSVPAYVYFVLAAQFFLGTWLFVQAIWKCKEALRSPELEVLAPNLQIAVWICLFFGSGVSFWFGRGLIGIALMLAAVVVPVAKSKRPPRGTEDWPEAEAAIVAKPTTEERFNPRL